MSNKGISINVSGGTSNLGNVVQGDGNTVTSHIEMAGGLTAEDFAKLRADLDALAAEKQVAYAEMRDLQGQLDDLEAMMASNGPVEAISRTAKSIYDNFGWAAAPLGAMLKVLF